MEHLGCLTMYNGNTGAASFMSCPMARITGPRLWSGFNVSFVTNHFAVAASWAKIHHHDWLISGRRPAWLLLTRSCIFSLWHGRLVIWCRLDIWHGRFKWWHRRSHEIQTPYFSAGVHTTPLLTPAASGFQVITSPCHILGHVSRAVNLIPSSLNDYQLASPNRATYADHKLKSPSAEPSSRIIWWERQALYIFN